jgi:hypothetical protein
MDLKINTPTPDNTVLRTRGTLRLCPVTFNATSTVPLNTASGEYTLIGNPFWAVVDWKMVQKSGVEMNIHYWDPRVNGTNNRGAYVTWNPVNGSSQGSALNQYIQPGQAFFVTTNGASPSITFAPDAIVGTTGYRTDIFSRSDIQQGQATDDGAVPSGRGSTGPERIQLTLHLRDRATQLGPVDGALVSYRGDFTDGYGSEDASKPTNLDENLATEYRGRNHSILGLPASQDVRSADTIPLRIWNLSASAYILRIGLKDLAADREVWLLDRASGVKVEVKAEGLEHAFTQASGNARKDDLVLVVHKRLPVTRDDGSSGMQLYPNPTTTGRVSFTLPTADWRPQVGRISSTVEVVDLSGTVRMTRYVTLDGKGQGELDASPLQSGAYILRVAVGDRVFTTKMIRQ